MPPKLERCVMHLMDQGHSKESAYAICNATLEAMQEPAEEKEPTPLAVTHLEKKADPVRKFYVGETKTLRNGDVEAYISTETVDRVGDVIKAAGWQLDNYRKSGSPVLFGHDYNQPPIGNAVDIQIQRKGLWSVTRFHEKSQRSKELAILAREKIMPAWSVGFEPTEKPEVRKDAEGGFLGFIFNKQELLEYSLVSVPANPEAVSKALFYARKGEISMGLVYELAGPSPLADKEQPAVDTKAEAEEVRARARSVIAGLNEAAIAMQLRSLAAGQRK